MGKRRRFGEIAISAKPLALVPARGGSERFPRKNLAQLKGKPLLAWTIEAALEAAIFDSVLVSSEDEEILAVAKQWGGTPLSRPPSLAGSRTTLDELAWDLCQKFQASSKLSGYSALYILLPTSPLRTSKSIRKAWESFLCSKADTLLSVVPLVPPPQWALTMQEGYLMPLFPNEYETDRHDLPPAFHHDGCHIITKIDRFLKEKSLLGKKTIPFFTPEEEAVDIDLPIHLKWAEFLLERKGT